MDTEPLLWTRSLPARFPPELSVSEWSIKTYLHASIDMLTTRHLTSTLFLDSTALGSDVDHQNPQIPALLWPLSSSSPPIQGRLEGNRQHFEVLNASPDGRARPRVRDVPRFLFRVDESAQKGANNNNLHKASEPLNSFPNGLLNQRGESAAI